jgi:hypothetical protein
MTTPQPPPSNPFDGFDTYSTVVQQPPVTQQQQQSPQQQNPFAASAIVDDGNPFATAAIMQQPQQQQPSPTHPQQQPQLYQQHSQPSFYPQQQMIPVAPSAASPWAMQQQQLLAPQQNINGAMASSPWALVQSQPQQQLFSHVASPAAVRYYLFGCSLFIIIFACLFVETSEIYPISLRTLCLFHTLIKKSSFISILPQQNINLKILLLLVSMTG